ncbi:MAG TPA: Glu-tRNA(Gln) amidotransferase subunit GatD, partial [Candidatus Acidoferrales bacterium]|nr:Glu-tRNA(Gln) amidotransferase subunit GatD [Candidatus Acidoferrales bacterium]
MPEELSGYIGLAHELLAKTGARIGDRIRLELKRAGGQEVVEGLLMPRYRTQTEENYVVVKLKTGYNVGVRIDPSTKIILLGAGQQPQFTRPPPPSQKPGLPKVSIVSTGGTIASKVDYRTGAVKPALDAEDLYSVVPELAELADIKANVLFSLFSENIGPQHWPKIAEFVADQAKNGADGVVIAHGTDTLGYTAAALSFALTDLPIPVVLVGSQRSSDRPSSDAASNLVAATAVAGQAPFAEVVVAMHDWISDEKVAVHRGTKVRKCHTSRRDAFRSVNQPPIAHYDLINRTLNLDTTHYRERRKGATLTVKSQFDPNVALIKFHPGISVGIIDWATATGFKGIVLEGSGLGHVGDALFSSLERAVSDGVVVGMCSQCIWGRVHMNVYSTGRDLLRIGVLPLGDMLSETALVKMMWAFGQQKNPENVKKIMTTNLADELSDRRELEAQ